VQKIKLISPVEGSSGDIFTDASASASDHLSPSINLNQPVDESIMAPMLAVSVHWLRKDRCGNRVIPFIKMGPHLIRYIPARVFETLDKNYTEGGPSHSK
jgi:hypothetical protein